MIEKEAKRQQGSIYDKTYQLMCIILTQTS